MSREKTVQVIKGIAIVVIIMAFCFGLRAHATDLTILPSELQDNYRDADGLPYFSEMDSYYNLRLTQDYMDHGYLGDIMLDNGTIMDMHRNSPEGIDSSSVTPMISWVTIGLYHLANMFHETSLKEVALYAGAIISVIAVIPAYTFTRRITNNYGAFVAAILICLGPNYFSHTFAGFFDTDMFNVFFPLFTFLFFTESVRSDKLISRVIYAILTVVTLMLFSIAWGGWYFYAFLLIGVAIIYYIIGFILKIDGLRSIKSSSNKLEWFLNQKMLFSIILIIAIGLILLIIQGGGLNSVTSLVNEAIGLFGLQSTSGVSEGLAGTEFPNVAISIGEMQIPNLLSGGLQGAFLASSQSVINGIGGIVALFGALIVFVLYSLKLWRLRPSKVKEVKKGKKSKVNRKSASQIKDENSRLKLAISELTNLHSPNEKEKDLKLTLLYYSTFLVWIGISAIAVTQGTRFIQVLLVPFGIVDGIFVGLAVDYIKENAHNEKVLAVLSVFCSFLIAFPIAAQINLNYGIILFIILAAISLIIIYGGKFFKETNLSLKKTVAILLVTIALIAPTVCAAYQTSEQVVPGTSDPMWNSMEYIKTNANNTLGNDTVVQSWWDFGYLFEIASDKQTFFDGGAQSGEGAFWTGRALSTTDLDLSKGIFTMLANSGTNATKVLNNYTGGNNSLSVDILLNTLPLSRDEAKNVMVSNYSLTEQQADSVLKYSHPTNPRDTVVVLSSDMLQKAGWWTYFGNWNFNEQNSTSLQYMVSTNVANITPNHTGSVNLLTENGIQFNAVIHRGENGTNQTTGQVETVFENNGSKIMINDTEYNPLKASNIMVIENNYLVKNQSLSDGEGGNYTLFVLGDGDNYNVILIDNKLVDSMFTKLFLLGGNGQNAFELVKIDSGVSLWKVNNNASSSSDTNTTS